MKLNVLLTIALGLTAVLWLTGCGAESPSDTPPEIRYGADVCDQCSMIISEPKYAASYVTTSGEVRRFDDVGELLAYDAIHKETVHIYWVHDYTSEEWIRADAATFVFNQGLNTPMGWGLAAFANESDATQLIHEQGGTSVTWATLQQAVASGELTHANLSGHIHDEPADSEDTPTHDHDG
jgi:copper chaperone NosL